MEFSAIVRRIYACRKNYKIPLSLRDSISDRWTGRKYSAHFSVLCIMNSNSKHLDDVFILLLRAESDSFLVHYPEPRPNNAHRWFFVHRSDSIQSSSVPAVTCQELVDTEVVVPDLDEEEYRIQLALGSVDCRVYRISPAQRAKTGGTYSDSNLSPDIDVS